MKSLFRTSSFRRLSVESLEPRTLLSVSSLSTESIDFVVSEPTPVSGLMSAATEVITVDSLNDNTTPNDGYTTLREAIDSAAKNPGSTIVFDQTGTIYLTSVLIVDFSVTIDATSVGGITLSGQNYCSIMDIEKYDDSPDETQVDVVLRSITFQNGKAWSDSDSDGGAISVDVPRNGFGLPTHTIDVTIQNCTFKQNTAVEYSDQNGNGGAIFNNGGNVNIYNTLFDHNTAQNGGAVYNSNDIVASSFELGKETDAPSVHNWGNVNLYNCTVVDNEAEEYGGGVYNGAFLKLYNSIVVNNKGGVSSVNSDIILNSKEISIFTWNETEQQYIDEISGYKTRIEGTNNITSDLSTAAIVPGSLAPSAVDASISTVYDKTKDMLFEQFSYRPIWDSIAIDAGETGEFSPDTYGSSFDLDGESRVNNNSIDIGAYELHYKLLSDEVDQTSVVTTINEVESKPMACINNTKEVVSVSANSVNEWSPVYVDLRASAENLKQWKDDSRFYYTQTITDVSGVQSETNHVLAFGVEVFYDSSLYTFKSVDKGNNGNISSVSASPITNGTVSVNGHVMDRVVISVKLTIDDADIAEFIKDPVCFAVLSFVPSTKSGAGVPVGTVRSFETDPWLAIGTSSELEVSGQVTTTYEYNTDSEANSVSYDLDDSGKVDMNDFIMFAKNFNKTPAAGAPSNDIVKLCNFDGAGSVDMNDFILFAKYFNKSAASVVLPASAELPVSAELPAFAELPVSTELPSDSLEASESPVEISVHVSMSSGDLAVPQFTPADNTASVAGAIRKLDSAQLRQSLPSSVSAVFRAVEPMAADAVFEDSDWFYEVDTPDVANGSEVAGWGGSHVNVLLPFQNI